MNRSEPCPGCSSPDYPCSCVACPKCATGIAPRNELSHACNTCAWRDDRCECGTLLTFNPEMRGTTCGGLDLVGWMRCETCQGPWLLCNRSKPAAAIDWRIAKGGRSVTAGPIKVRAEKGDNDEIAAVMERIARVPELEIENERLREMLKRRGVEA